MQRRVGAWVTDAQVRERGPRSVALSVLPASLQRLGERCTMNEFGALLVGLAIAVVWILLMKVILPRLGVPT